MSQFDRGSKKLKMDPVEITALPDLSPYMDHNNLTITLRVGWVQETVNPTHKSRAQGVCRGPKEGLGSLGGRSGVPWGSVWGLLGVSLGSLRGRSGVPLGSVLGPLGVGLGSLWGRSGVPWGSVWCPSGVGLGSLGGRSGHPADLLEPIRGGAGGGRWRW